ncbi:MAG: response regulator transcription factor, partial [Caldilineaceae bacterium]|nr:response regulator transcription factor [Caldilineaceae bacterium]
MQGATILVVEDEQSISEVVTLYLTRSGYQVITAHDGRAALQELTKAKPDLIILDLMLPEIDGWEITRRVRAEGNTPIIMVTARREESDRILGLEMGADDYVVKPFSPQELVSRVRAVLRRAQQPPPAPHSQLLTFPGLRIDPVTRLVTVNGAELML